MLFSINKKGEREIRDHSFQETFTRPIGTIAYQPFKRVQVIPTHKNFMPQKSGSMKKCQIHLANKASLHNLKFPNP